MFKRYEPHQLTAERWGDDCEEPLLLSTRNTFLEKIVTGNEQKRNGTIAHRRNLKNSQPFAGKIMLSLF